MKLLKTMQINKVSILCIFLVQLFYSCTISRKYPKTYYNENMQAMHSIEYYYKMAIEKNRLGIAFNDLEFNDISLEIKTDTVRYIYNFEVGQASMNDTLKKYDYDTTVVNKTIQLMKSIRCTWVNALSYYTDSGTKRIVFMSVPVKQFSLIPVFKKRKYYLFNFYEQAQYYDEQGRLLDKRTIRRLRKVNREIFYRVTNKVAYTISNKFR